MAHPLHLFGFLCAAHQNARSKCPYQSLFSLRQGVVFSRGPSEIVEAVERCQNINIPDVPGDQFFASSSASLSKPEILLMAPMSLLNSPASSILPGSCTGSLVP